MVDGRAAGKQGVQQAMDWMSPAWCRPASREQSSAMTHDNKSG